MSQNPNTFINYAHRGASEYCPENTMLSFYTGLYMGANGIETDIQKTKDGIPVLYHDNFLDRMTGEAGSIKDYTWEELKVFWVKKGKLRDKIVSLEDFLEHFACQDIRFAIELKGADAEKETADLLRKYHMADKTVVTSFHLDYLEAFRAYAPEFSIGFLAKEINENVFAAIKAMKAEEICPPADLLTKQLVETCKAKGFQVRAWGVKSEEHMRHAYGCGVYGMTVNFPDRLTAYLEEIKWIGGI